MINIRHTPVMGYAAVALTGAALWGAKEALFGSDTKLGDNFRVNKKLFQSPTLEHTYGSTVLSIPGGELTQSNLGKASFKNPTSGASANIVVSQGADGVDLSTITRTGSGYSKTHSANPRYDIATNGTVRLGDTRSTKDNQLTIDLGQKNKAIKTYQFYPSSGKLLVGDGQ
jgi:hypothetical protein